MACPCGNGFQVPEAEFEMTSRLKRINRSDLALFAVVAGVVAVVTPPGQPVGRVIEADHFE